jgi:hypothetical protein
MAYFSSSIYSALVSVTGADPGFVGPESYTSLGPSLRKIIHNYENEFRYKIEYLFRKRK